MQIPLTPINKAFLKKKISTFANQLSNSGTVLNLACNQKAYKDATKPVTDRFEQMMANNSNGSQKDQCQLTQQMNEVTKKINQSITGKCHTAILSCKTTCGMALKNAKVAHAAAIEPTAKAMFWAEMTAISKSMTSCASKWASVKKNSDLQIARNTDAIKQAKDCVDGLGGSGELSDSSNCNQLPLAQKNLCQELGEVAFCKQHPKIDFCRSLSDSLFAGKTDTPGPGHTNANAIASNPLKQTLTGGGDESLGNSSQQDLATSEICQQHPDSPQCKRDECNSLPTSTTRGLCHSEGIEKTCKYVPQLPRCKKRAADLAKNKVDPLSGHTSLGLKGGFAGGGSAGGSAGGGSSSGGGSGSGGLGGSDFASGDGAEGLKPLTGSSVIKMDKDGNVHALVNGRYTNLGSGRRARNLHKKISGLSYSDYLLRKPQKRGPASVQAVKSEDVTPANGLSNFQKVSRTIKLLFPTLLYSK